MFNSKKRPTAASSSTSSTNKPFNPAHTHPASISSSPSVQSRVHVTSAASKGTDGAGSSSTPVEGIQSGGGGGGGAGAGSFEGIEGKGIDKATKQGKSEESASTKSPQKGRGGEADETDSQKWSDPKRVHPAWEGFGKGPGASKDAEGEKGKDPKAKL
ncbi:hypothetical protein IAU59_004426 [Kwoniella sp. CBS 9459]